MDGIAGLVVVGLREHNAQSVLARRGWPTDRWLHDCPASKTRPGVSLTHNMAPPTSRSHARVKPVSQSLVTARINLNVNSAISRCPNTKTLCFLEARPPPSTPSHLPLGTPVGGSLQPYRAPPKVGCSTSPTPAAAARSP
jgi:hypothetical protein